MCGISIAAFLLRLWVSWELAHGTSAVILPGRSTDLRTYMELSRAILGGTFSGTFYYQPYYYACFLPLVGLIFGKSVAAVVVIQALLSSLTVLLTGLIAKRLHSSRAGIGAAILCAISTPLLLYVPYHQIATLQTFHLALLIYCLILGLDTGKIRYFWGVGIIWGIGILTRGNLYLLFPQLLGLPFWYFCRQKRYGRGVAVLLLITAMMVAVQLPFAIYNSFQTGKLSGPSTASSAVLALGNTPEAPPGGRMPGVPAGPMEYPESYHIFMEREAQGESVPEQILEWFADEPAAYLELTFRKLLLFWEYGEIPNNVSLYHDGKYSFVLRYNLLGASGLLLSLALGGMFLFGRRLVRERDLKLMALYLAVILYWGSIAVFYILSRFRAPVLPLLAVFAGLFLAEFDLKNRMRNRNWVIALLAGVFIVFSANNLYRDLLEAPMLRLARPDGVVIENGQNEQIHFDHGPFTFGKWTQSQLQSGDTFSKTFGGDWPETADARLKIQFFAENGNGGMSLKINGQTHQLDFRNKHGLYIFELPVTLKKGTLDFTVGRLDPGLGICGVGLDLQRNYRRSQLNGVNPGGEFIMRIYYQDKE